MKISQPKRVPKTTVVIKSIHEELWMKISEFIFFFLLKICYSICKPLAEKCPSLSLISLSDNLYNYVYPHPSAQYPDLILAVTSSNIQTNKLSPPPHTDIQVYYYKFIIVKTF